MKVPWRRRAAYDYDTGYESYGEEQKPPLLVRFWKAASFYIITALVFLLLNLFVVRLGLVNGESMEPTLHNRDVVVIWQLLYSPEPGDIIVTDKNNELGISLTKRVIATGGQRVSIADGAVTIDGTPRYEDYLMEADWGGGALELTVPDDYVFLMGDNRNGSYDSRELGCFPAKSLMGEVVVRIFPFSGIHSFLGEG